MIKIEMNGRHGTIEIKGTHADVLAEAVVVIVKLLDSFNDDDIKIIQELMTEAANEQI